MPHICVETTSDVVENQDIVDILQRLVDKLSTFESVSPASIKAYHSLRHTWIIGENGPNGFIHCEVAILTGRDTELKKTIADGMYAELLDCFHASRDSKEAGITLELREMDKETYRK
jgi:5-carboxymethyl-2-hydroxymuconate isomerase